LREAVAGGSRRDVCSDALDVLTLPVVGIFQVDVLEKDILDGLLGEALLRIRVEMGAM
jgi:hypothetical protein